jgi:hypothetical protein
LNNRKYLLLSVTRFHSLTFLLGQNFRFRSDIGIYSKL